MNTKRILTLSVLCLLLVVVIAACGGVAAEPAASTPEQLVAEEPAVQATAPPTSTPVPAEPTAMPATETAVPPTPEPTQEPPTPTPEPTNTPEPPPPWAADLVGIWFKPGLEAVRGKDYFMQFFDGETYRVAETQSQLASGYEVEGNYHFEGDVYVALDTGGKIPCPGGEIGRYQLTISPGESLRVMQLEEACRARAANFEGSWTWVSP